ncbi:MAG: hypothetical protein PHP54_00265 [Clostridia bacterium]|nr:hypothetical protein [Clostridia bacterium]
MKDDINIIIALNNEYITNHIKETYGDSVYEYDISSKEDVIEILSKNVKQYTIITKDNLEGQLDTHMYIKQMKLASPNTKIIYIVEELSAEYKQFLFANEVFNIIEAKELTMENLDESMHQDKSVIYKSKNEVVTNNEMKESQVLPKKLIAIYGTSGAGKSYFSSILAESITRDIGISVALLDMDVQNPSVDIYNNISINLNGLSSIIDEMDSKKEMNEILDKYMICDKNNKKLWYMTNNSSIFDIQNKYSNSYYERIYNSVNLRYDYTIIDLPSTPFLDVVPYTLLNATDIFFVLNPNYISIRQAIKYLELITKLWDVPKEKINIIINKKQKNSLENIQVKSLINGYRIAGEIIQNDNMDVYINSPLYNKNCIINQNKIYESLGIKSLDGNQKSSFNGMKMYHMLKKKIEVNNAN